MSLERRDGYKPNPLSERELVAMAKASPDGFRDAFGELYQRYLPRIYTYHYYRLRDPHVAEDATQETFERAMRGFGNFQYRNKESYSTWLFQIAHNYTANVYRSNSRRKTVSLTNGLSDDMERTLTSPFGEPEVEIEEEDERLKAVREAVLALPDDQKNLILLKFVGDLSNREIGHILGATEGATKAKLFRIIRKLKKQFTQKQQV